MRDCRSLVAEHCWRPGYAAIPALFACFGGEGEVGEADDVGRCEAARSPGATAINTSSARMLLAFFCLLDRITFDLS